MPLFERLDVWQLSQRLASQIYDLTGSFPNEHAFGLVSQLRRAALSIPTNIAEGNESGSPREKIRFFLIAKRSAAEVRSLLRFASGLQETATSWRQPTSVNWTRTMTG
ncbi:MAG: four helix bundle protein [Armatimonadetes bacterium]|nr:four helix bundle protein [Armatimonadota bacterium]